MAMFFSIICGFLLGLFLPLYLQRGGMGEGSSIVITVFLSFVQGLLWVILLK